ncbi:MAG TPA: CHAT domain-containing protein [Gemmatimonadaceae bacterium]|nr:CHAT domain-containing protein [Gemmatimonadaceae bacterium]
MLARTLPLLFVTTAFAPVVGAQRAHTSDSRAIIREAERAVQDRQTPALATRWNRELEQHPDDPAALFAHATLARLTYRYADATRDYDRLLSLPASSATRYRAYSDLGKAEILQTGGREAAADSAMRSALALARASRDSAAEVYSYLSLGALRVHDSAPEVAQADFDSAKHLLPANDPELRARARCGAATVLVRGARKEAVTEARAGARLAREAGAMHIVAYCLHIAASGYERLGRVYTADRLLDTAATIARALGDRRALASILQWRGYAAFEREQADSAQRLLGEAIAEGEATGSLSPLAWSTLNLGQVSMSLDDPISAQAHMTRALALMRQLGDDWGTSIALGYMAELAREEGELDHADSLLREFSERARHSGDAIVIAQTNISLAAIAGEKRDWVRTAAWLDSAGVALRQSGHTGMAASLPYEHGVLALWKGDPAEAERLFRAALPTTDTSEHVSRYLLQSRLASARLALGDTADAERMLATATDEIDSWRSGLSDSSLRVLAFRVSDRFGGPDLGAVSVIAAIAASGHIAPAFELAERRRARVLRDGLLRTRNAKSASATHGAFTLDASRVTLAAVAKAIPARAALIEFVAGRGGQPTTAIVITQKDNFAIPIVPVDSMRNDIDRYLAVVQSERNDSVGAVRLGAEIFGKVLRRLSPDVNELVLVPEDVLHRLPFAALIVDGHRVAERYSVHVTPSAAIALSLWGARRSPGIARMIAFGDAHFPSDDARNPPVTRAHFAAFASNGGLTRLSASATEVREAVRHWPQSQALLGADASEVNLKRIRLDQFRLVHFATHAEVDERSPGRSAIALAAGGGEDGFVTSADLAALRLDADLVMLSGCSTAMGLIVNGEGILGLTGPLLQAGAHSVVATLWPVSDRQSAEFVQRFYGYLAGGVAATDALRLAQVDAMKRGVSPRDWAAFVLTGDGFVRVGATTTASH